MRGEDRRTTGEIADNRLWLLMRRVLLGLGQGSRPGAGKIPSSRAATVKAGDRNHPDNTKLGR